MGSVKSIIDQSIVVFKDQQISAPDREQKLRSSAESHFDFAEMSRSAIGYHWKTLTPAQQREFVPLFTAFIEDAYLSRIESYSVEKVNEQLKSSTIQFTHQTNDGSDYAEVFSTVALKDQKDPIPVNYLMRRDANEWKIYDLTDRRDQRNRQLPQPVQPRPEQRRLRQTRPNDPREDEGSSSPRQHGEVTLGVATRSARGGFFWVIFFHLHGVGRMV